MAGRILISALCLASASAALVRSGTFLATDGGDQMRPEVVANTLAHVEDDWKAQAATFTVVQGSGGDRAVAKEYMGNVCNQKSLAGWHRLRCQDFASAIVDHAMTADSYANRQNPNSAKFCSGFWSKFVEAERMREAEEAKQRVEREKKEAEERAEREKKEAAERAVREAQEAAEAAAAKKKAEEEAKAEAKKRAEDEAKKAEEKAKQEAAEAKAWAAEAAARLAQKKAEAEAVQKAAQHKLEEAEKAEQEHLARLAEHKQAEEALRNVAKAVHSSSINSTETELPTVPAASKPQENITATVAAPEVAAEHVVKKVETISAKPTTNATRK